MLLLPDLVLLVAILSSCASAATIQQRSDRTAIATRVQILNERVPWGTRLRNIFTRGRRPFTPVEEKKPKGHHLSRYVNDKVLRFNITDVKQAHKMADAINSLYLDVWSTTKTYVDIRLPQGVVPLLLDMLGEDMQESHSPLMHSLVDTALESYPGGLKSPLPERMRQEWREEIKTDESLFFQDYRPLSVIVPWMNLLQSMFPSIVELIKIGESYEHRPIYGLKVGKRQGGSKKKTIIVTGASHAREWISVSTVSYIAYSLITGYGKESKGIDNMVDNFDWVFIPTLNVDGYVYTWENDRLWKKNRQPTTLSFCKGIDLDRAYSFHFDSSTQSSSNPCSDMFPGGYPFEAVESRAFANWVDKITQEGSEIVGLLDLHSYSQQILFPYSYTCAVNPPDLENIEELAIGLAKAIRLQSGEHYEVASACESTAFNGFPGTTGSGSMLDYLHAIYHVPYTYQIKLRDTGSHGFLLPKENIVPTGDEIFSVLKYFAQFISDDGSPMAATPTVDIEL